MARKHLLGGLPCHGCCPAALAGSGFWQAPRPRLYNESVAHLAPWVRSMPVQMKLSRIVINESSEHQCIYLREAEGSRSFPIVIGIFEATSIDRRVKRLTSPRPLTHDLIVSVADNLGAELQSVLISELKEGTYYARLRLKRDGELVEVDARPSDAIAVAVTCDPPLPIYVNEEVLDEALRP